MNKTIIKYGRNFKRYIRKTYKNKLCVLILLMIGILSANELGDGTFLLFVMVFGLPLFFTSEDLIQ